MLLKRQLTHLIKVGTPVFVVVYFLFSLLVNSTGGDVVQFKLDIFNKTVAKVEEHGGIKRSVSWA